MKITTLLIPATALALCLGCHGKSEPAADSVADGSALHIAIGGFTDTVDVPVVKVKTPKAAKTPAAPRRAKATPSPLPQRAAGVPRERQSAKAPAIKETIYVESEDARGRVWGHVTMQGDRGHGTIHDEGENTYTVTVTRHGSELFAVDQNSRQYVFKLKK